MGCRTSPAPLPRGERESARGTPRIKRKTRAVGAPFIFGGAVICPFHRRCKHLDNVYVLLRLRVPCLRRAGWFRSCGQSPVLTGFRSDFPFCSMHRCQSSSRPSVICLSFPRSPAALMQRRRCGPTASIFMTGSTRWSRASWIGVSPMRGRSPLTATGCCRRQVRIRAVPMPVRRSTIASGRSAAFIHGRIGAG